jgi:hypothetical protein
MEPNAEPKSGQNRLFVWVGLAFVVQMCAWGVFIWLSQKANHDEVPLEHKRQVDP